MVIEKYITKTKFFQKYIKLRKIEKMIYRSKSFAY